MAPSPPDKHTVSYNSPHNWLMSLVMDLATLYECVGRNGTNGCHLSVFSVDIAFVCHFAAPYPPYRSDCSIGYTSKKAI